MEVCEREWEKNGGNWGGETDFKKWQNGKNWSDGTEPRTGHCSDNLSNEKKNEDSGKKAKEDSEVKGTKWKQ